MIQKLELTGVHLAIDERAKRYVAKKIGKLDRYVPHDSREPLHAEVVLTEEDGKAKNRFTAEATLHLPNEVLSAKEATISIYAAIDIVEAKLKTQLQKYKSKSTNYRHRARLFLRRMGRLRRRGRS